LNPTRGKRFFPSPNASALTLGPTQLLFSGYLFAFLSGAEVKNKWDCRCTSAPWGAWYGQRQLYLYYIMPIIYLGGANILFKIFEVIYTGRHAALPDPHGKMRPTIWRRADASGK
jgi:hypothetical protein